METIQKVVNDNADSLNMGSASKEGAFKIYGDFNKLDEFKKKIDNALLARQYAKAQIGVNV